MQGTTDGGARGAWRFGWRPHRALALAVRAEALLGLGRPLTRLLVDLPKIADGALGQPEGVARGPLTSQISLGSLSTKTRMLSTRLVGYGVLYPAPPR